MTHGGHCGIIRCSSPLLRVVSAAVRTRREWRVPVSTSTSFSHRSGLLSKLSAVVDCSIGSVWEYLNRDFTVSCTGPTVRENPVRLKPDRPGSESTPGWVDCMGFPGDRRDPGPYR